ncbi:ADP-ribosylglycohydrolase family protein [Streptomyces sp. NPDC048385]|uniref:ADP-ribosylglycohydrolase family protein n=1 Tax=unclassified Streptomyces TaxID=2593676 RepID=UPI003435A795
MLAQRRGSAPATITALSGSGSGSPGNPTASRGCHALTRTLPVAVAVAGHGSDYWVKEARAMAALTHGDPAAQSAAAHAVVLAARCLTSGAQPQVRRALREGIRFLREVMTGAELNQLTNALERAGTHPADAHFLAHVAPDATAPSALLGGVYVAASFPERNQVGDALRFAAGAPDGDSVACVTGALLGAAHGAEALPLDLVSRHELAWVLDTLARDLIAQIADSPSGGEYTAGWDPHWWDRYPGW